MMTDAQAKRFGGGGSFGVNRSASSFSHFNSSRSSMPPIAPRPASTASKWLGPLAGVAAGGLLASLFMGHGGGFGSGIFSWLLIGGLIFFVWRLFSNKTQPVTQPPMNMNYQVSPQPVSNASANQSFSASCQQTTAQRPAGFDEAAFLRQAKATFIRLQAAYDTKNLADIREFTAPEIFAEIQLQLQERGNEPNQTDVINIDSQLLDIATEAQTTTASVMFVGLIREQQGAEPVNVKEIWNFQKNAFMPTWVVAGIQQA